MIPGDYPIVRVQYGYTPVEKGAEGFVERGGLESIFKPTGSLFVGEVERPTQKANKRKLREGKPSLNGQRLEIGILSREKVELSTSPPRGSLAYSNLPLRDSRLSSSFP
ncbi:type VI secretion protein [Cucumis melo var. makuwa]|uniref:Type VI secretion protein n=1 Tax=Cucumis melo var. makuwa TaxID=1194695 RepID=A0A5A7U4R9_CUCMM|nr:type VI secretion protein [Cucumis melo var. makuwa]